LVGSIVVLGYYLWEQRQSGLLRAHAEWVRFGWAALMFGACFAAARVLLHFVPAGQLLPSLRGH
jgi:hypothetical protein